MKKAGIAALLGLLTALAVGCGGSNETSAPTPGTTGETTQGGSQTTTVPGENGADVPAGFSQGQLPKDYPSDLPVYPGAQPTTALMVGGSGLIVLSSNASVADVLAYYREQLPSQGWTVDEVSESPGRVSARKGTRSATISISEGSGGTEIGIGLQ